MEPTGTFMAESSQLASIQKKISLDNRIRNGVGWFYWIAGLSILNSVIYLFGSTISFVVGLGTTQIVDNFMSLLAEDLGPGWIFLRYVGFMINICIAVVFILIGFLGRKRYRWAIIIGMVIYALDGVILLVFQLFLGTAFHVWALMGIWSGLNSIKELELLEESGTSESIDGIRQKMSPIQSSQKEPRSQSVRLILIALIIFFIALIPVITVLQR